MAKPSNVLNDTKRISDKLILQKEKYRKKKEKLFKAFEDSQRQGNPSESIICLAKHVKAQDHEIDNIHNTLESLISIQKKTLKTIFRNKLCSNPNERSINHFISDETSTDDEASDGHDVLAADGIAVDNVKARGDNGKRREKQQTHLITTTPDNTKYGATRPKDVKESRYGTESTGRVTVEDKVEKSMSTDEAKKTKGMEISPVNQTEEQTADVTNGASNKVLGQRRIQNQAFVPMELWQSQAKDISDQAKKLLDSEQDEASFIPGLYTVLCLDASASMAGERWRIAQEFLLKYFRHMELEAEEFDRVERVALVVFGDEIKVVYHFTRDYKMIQEYIGSVVPSGSTNLFAALTLCQGVLEGGGITITFSDSLVIRPRILLITDGYATCPDVLGGEDEFREPLRMGVNTSIIRAQILSDVGVKIFPLVVTGADDVMVPSHLARVTGGRLLSEDATIQGAIKYKRFFRLHRNYKLAGLELKDAGLFRLLFLPLPSPDTTPEDEADIQGIVKEQRDRHEDILDSKNYPLGVPENMPELGARVRRGPEWAEFSDLDGKGCGTVIGHRQNGYVRVQWDNNNKGVHQYGADGRYAVIVVDEPRLMEEKMLSTGCKVIPGPDWEPEDDINKTIKLYDIGTIIKARTCGLVTVVWPDGKVKEYAFGYRFHHEVKPYKRDGTRPAITSDVQENLNSIKPRQPSVSRTEGETANVETQQENLVAIPSLPVREGTERLIDARPSGVNGEQKRDVRGTVRKNKNVRVTVTPQRSRANSITPLSGQVESSTEQKSCEFYWQYRIRDKKTWKTFPGDVSNEIEDAFRENSTRTLQVDQGGQPYRIIPSTFQMVHIPTKTISEIRRVIYK